MSDRFQVKDMNICVTGASSGIGQSIATMLVSHGANVIAVARREDNLQQWCDDVINQGAINQNVAALDAVDLGRAEYVVADLSDHHRVAQIAKEIESVYGNVDVLINAAGINPRIHADSLTHEQWDITLNVNLATPFFLAQALVEKMKNKQWGRIINFASLQSKRAFANGLAYGSSKAGVAHLTRAMAEAWSGSGINVNAIAPGFFPTELTGPVFADEALSQRHAEQTCIGRNGQLDDLFGPVLFFCSQASQYVTGQTLFVDGGFTAK